MVPSALIRFGSLDDMSSVKNGEGQDGKKFYSQKRLVRDETPAKEAERRHPAMFCPVVKQRPSQDPEKAGSSTKKDRRKPSADTAAESY